MPTAFWHPISGAFIVLRAGHYCSLSCAIPIYHATDSPSTAIKLFHLRRAAQNGSDVYLAAIYHGGRDVSTQRLSSDSVYLFEASVT